MDSFNCRVCWKIFKKNKRTLSTHIRTVHGNNTRHKCDTCDKAYRQKSGLVSHIDSVHRNLKFECKLCGKEFSSMGILNSHVRVFHNKSKAKEIKCDICDKILSCKAHLKPHKDQVHYKMKFKCEQCDKEFTAKSACIERTCAIFS